MATKKAEFVRCDSGGPGCKDCPHSGIHQRVRECVADYWCPGCKPVHTDVWWVPVAPNGERGSEHGSSKHAQLTARYNATPGSLITWPAAKKLGWRVQMVYVVDAEG